MGKMADSDVFGKEIGLVHKAVITGRKVGADKKFWTTLADNEEVFKKVVQFIDGQERPTIDFHIGYYAMTVHVFIDSLETEEIIKRLKKIGKRPATLEELLYARSQGYVDIKISSRVVALGSILRDRHGNRIVISLLNDSVDFHPFVGRIWPSCYLFAALPKSK